MPLTINKNAKNNEKFYLFKGLIVDFFYSHPK